ncbi:MAG: hypothetical protein ACYDG2_09430 [Ruminiclostridium sp.]
MNKIKSKSKAIISLFALFISLYCSFVFANMYNSYYSPKSPKLDIVPILSNKVITQKDYSLLFSQTGLAKPAIDDLLFQKNGLNKILSYQAGYYTKNKIYIEKLNPFTSQENILVSSTINDSHKLAPLKNGDILLTKSTHTLYWRHGHCGIVIDAKNGITLESLQPGTLSIQQNISKWQAYPTLKLMRLRGVNQDKLDEVAGYAAEALLGIDYGIFASKKHKDKFAAVNCSQLLYQAFIHFGYDIDSNKGIFVTPENIAKSKLLDIVQIYGFDPNRDW